MRPRFEAKVVEASVPPPARDLSLKLKVGKFLSGAIDLYKARKELTDIASVVHAQALADRMSKSQFEQLRRHQTDTLALDIRKRDFRNTETTKSYQGIAYHVIDGLLERDRSVQSVLNIGCNYAYMDWLLAKKYPNVRFCGVDVNVDIPQINADLALPNTEFHSGYALEMLESGALGADLIYMSSTSTVIRNPELRKYLELISKRTKYCLFSEPIWRLPGDELRDPKTIHSQDSLPAFVQRDSLTGNFGYLCWNHNYRGMLEQAGFDVIEYRFYRPEFTQLYWCVALGENRNEALWT